MGDLLCPAVWMFLLGPNEIPSRRFQADFFPARESESVCLFAHYFNLCVFGKMDRKPFPVKALSETQSNGLRDSLNSQDLLTATSCTMLGEAAPLPGALQRGTPLQNGKQKPRCSPLLQLCPGAGRRLWGDEGLTHISALGLVK